MFKTIERQIIEQTVEHLLNNGYTLSVNDGEETILPGATNKRAILKAMFSTYEDTIYAKKDGKESFVLFLHGGGVDVINDYGTSLEKTLAPVIDAINKL